ncbi:DUF2177 family protein [Pseudacidovorax intermedius]|uniref:Membrane protein n=1 Tax=Pseudacidovorax intermedius TaxID=433924 RepID=A0A147GP59_9BURK|nr:DUF2177 family protein [Pseudacidovorax intermedius]KTT15794.1 membrane protein [Pseudacidovorax intermedius]
MNLPFAHYLTAYGIAAVVFLGLDAIWLGTMASRLYRPAIGHLMADGFAVAPAVLFYLLYLVGMVVFAIGPALEARKPLQALAMGALLGLICYATYDLTNQATLKQWPWAVTLADLAWGAFVTGVSSAVATRLTLAWRG